ncbi:MAG TPA: PAS domain-containing protein, partial [Lacunisphaera sp.]|nr:PAS domain-containing protein [Lacunisphaera sp.]
MPATSKHVTTATAPGEAVLVVSANGRVELASASACTLWRAKPAELVGDTFPNLFAFEVVSRESGWVQSQWEVLLAAAVERPVTLRLQPKETGEFNVLVRIEKTGTEPAQYLAFVTPIAAANPGAAVTAPPSPEHFLALLNERSPLGFFDLNFLKHEVYYSPTWKKQLGYTDATLPNTYDSWLALIHPDDSAAAPDRQGRAGSTGTRQFSHECRMKHALGHYVWLQCTGVQAYGPNGALQRVTGAHLDIGDRKEFEESGLRAEERLRELGERGRVGLFDLDFSAGVFWLSPGFKAFLGYSDGELPNALESVLRSLPMEETSGGLQAYFLARHPDQVSYFDVIQLKHREDRYVPVQACIVRQISRRKELQRVLGFAMPVLEGTASGGGDFSSAHLTVMLAELQEGVLVADAGGKVLHLNAKAEKLLQRTLAQSLGQDAGEVFRLVHRENAQPGENPIAKALATGEPTTLNNALLLE